MKNTSLIWILILALFATMLLCGTSAQADGFEPETGVFAEYAPEPYHLIWHQILFGEDRYRFCQLVTLPSFEPASVVYFVQSKNGSVTVVSRTLKPKLWDKMFKEMEKAGNISLDVESQSKAIEKLNIAVDTKRAILDFATAQQLSDICTEVLLQVHYPERRERGFDGTTYHVSTWITGGYLSGMAWSPANGTLAQEFVAMELALKAYAESPLAERSKVKTELLKKANHLEQRLKTERAAKPRDNKILQ